MTKAALDKNISDKTGMDKSDVQMIAEKFMNEVKDTFGMAMPDDRIIWLNPRLCKREYSVLVTTIVHELLHVKYPSMKENKILDLERNLIYLTTIKMIVEDFKVNSTKLLNLVFAFFPISLILGN